MSPIRPENRARYPAGWPAISLAVRERAGWRCECDGRCGGRSCGTQTGTRLRCTAEQYQEHPVTGSLVVLTVAHLDHTPENCSLENLKAMCQACHLSYDRDHHAVTAQATRAAELAAQMDPLFDVTEPAR